MNYKQRYIKHHNLSKEDVLLCKLCGSQAVDLHHVHPKGMSSRKFFLWKGKQYDINDPINLIPVCRVHHENIHQYSIDYLMIKNK